MKQPTQCDRVLDWLKRHGDITPMDAWNELGVYRLSGRIFDLRQMGYNIKTGRKDVVNRYGEKCQVAEYRLLKTENPAA